MKKKEREISNEDTIESIIKRAKVCRLAMSSQNIPYVIPTNYGFKDNCFYIHSAKEGKKIDILKQNNKVCIEIDISNEIIKSKKPCSWSINYQSVICYGDAEFIDTPEDKINALRIIMEHYSPKMDYEFQVDIIEKLIIIKIQIEKITGKQSISS